MNNEKPFWQKANKSSIDDFIKLLDYHTLDPTMLNYGKYARVIHPYEYCPGHRPEKSLYDITSSFLDLAWHIDKEEISKEDWLKAKKAINKHLKSQKFQMALNNKFNCVSLQTTLYLHKQFPSHIDKWWIDRRGDKLYPITNWWCDEFKEEWKDTVKSIDPNPNIVRIECRPNFKEIHWRNNAEFNELQSLLGDYGIGKTTRLVQSRRHNPRTEDISNLKGFKEVTLQTTGRKLAFKDNYYSFEYIELDPVVPNIIQHDK